MKVELVERREIMKVRMAFFAVAGVITASALFTAVNAQPSFQEAPAPTTKTVWDGVYTQAQAVRGKAAYGQNCAACHGDDLAGMEMAPPLTGPNFMSNWNSLTAGALFERIQNTMPLTNPGSMSQATSADILAYVLSANKFPAGKVELPADALPLKTVKILAQKP